MKIKGITGIVVFCLAAGSAPPAVRAAAPRVVTNTGAPYVWNNANPIGYNIDQGPLGSLSNAKATTLVETAFQQWSSISTAKLTFQEGDPLDRDVTGANAADFFNGLPSDVNPVIFDNDGSVVDGFLGNGASESVLAFGGPYQATPTGTIAQGIVVINARAMDGLFDPDDVAPDDLTRAVVRAVGQMLGIGSSDTNDELIFDGDPKDNSAVPVMHPGTALGNIIGGGFKLTLDDQMAASTLYPATSFATSTGTIHGQVLLPDGTTGLQGIDVIARKVDDPVNSAVSAISGVNFRTQSRGAEDVTQRGAFEIHVPPGNYTLEFRPLRANIGPLGTAFPLPGGRQFYQATGAPAPTAGPAIPASATPVTVTAGQTTEVKFVAAGTPAPAPMMVAQVKPNNTPASAQLLPLSAVVTGNVSPTDPGTVVIALGQDSNGASLQDKVENLYRLVVPQRSIVTLYLQPKDKVTLELYFLQGILGSANPAGAASLSVSDTGARSLQVLAAPGTYYVGVSAWDAVQHPAATDYTLSVTTTPFTDAPAPAGPVLDQVVLGDVTATSATASWITDTDTTADAIVGIPRQDVGDATAAKAHHLPITGLTAGTDADLIAIAQTPDTFRQGALPRVFFHTADATAASGDAQLQATILGAVGQTIGTADAPQDTVLVEIGIHNSGGPATNVQITGLTPSTGWSLAQPLTQPLTIGGIGSNGTALAIVRLLRQGTGPAPLASLTGTGTLAGAGGTTANFTITGP